MKALLSCLTLLAIANCNQSNNQDSDDDDCSDMRYNQYVNQLSDKKINWRTYADKILKCVLVNHGKNNIQPPPQCLMKAPPEMQAVAKINNRGTITLKSGYELKFHLKGVISFFQTSKSETRIYAFFHGVKDFFQDSEFFSMHIHELGEIEPSCTATGGHYNPCGKNHSNVANTRERHVGDLAKVKLTQGSNTLIIDLTDSQAKLSGPISVLGRSITVHAGAKSSRVGCGTIAVTRWTHTDHHPDVYFNDASPTPFWQ